MKALIFTVTLVSASASFAASCQQVAQTIAQQKSVPAAELSDILYSLNRTQRLPEKFVTKKQAKNAGWQPGDSLWQTQPGKSIGGDRFNNREQRLPHGNYFEADLDYQGKKRNAKRFIYTQNNAARYITTDHYATFTEVPACQ
jgi:hypothetical protein